MRRPPLLAGTSRPWPLMLSEKPDALLNKQNKNTDDDDNNNTKKRVHVINSIWLVLTIPQYSTHAGAPKNKGDVHDKGTRARWAVL